MPLVKLHPDAFSRFYEGVGYIINQFTRVNHLFDVHELTYLKAITRVPREADDIVADLQIQIADNPPEKIKANFYKLISVLENAKLVVTGRDRRELDHNQATIYEKPYAIFEGEPIGQYVNSGGFFYKYFEKRPTIFGSQVDVTSHCNLVCRHCYYPPVRTGATLDTELAFDVLDQLSAMGTLAVTFSGGEPLLHKDFGKILRRARAADLLITIQSNAWGVDERAVEFLREANISTYQISLYSLVPEDHDRITGVPGSLLKTLRGIDLLQRASIPVLVGCHVMKSNRDSYLTVAEWASRQGIGCNMDFLMMARTDFSTANLKESLDMRETEDVVREMLAYENDIYDFGKSLRQSPIDLSSFQNKRVCDVGNSGLCIAANGDCYPCSGFQGYVVGNVRKQSLAEIWNHSETLKKLRGMTWADFPECLKCEAFQFCSMCLVRNFNANHGDLLKPTSHQCEISRINMRAVREKWSEASCGRLG